MKPPIGQKVSEIFFQTKQEAKQYGIDERRRKAGMGLKTRYEIDMDAQTGQFKVREFIYDTDKRGRLK
jgi:hypothetical protein